MSAITQTTHLLFCSPIGKKLLVALTGVVLVLYVLGHLIGNLLIFKGPDDINEYGHFLHTTGHGALIWVARAVLLACVLTHIIVTIILTKENKAARLERYGKPKTIQASRSSLIMIWTGLVILAFIVYHIMHFTLHVGNDYGTYLTHVKGETELVPDVYNMVVAGFSWLPASLFYIFAMGLLCSHLSHGFSSMFQTLGLATARTWPTYKAAGIAFGWFIFLGNSAIPIAVLLHFVQPHVAQ